MVDRCQALFGINKVDQWPTRFEKGLHDQMLTNNLTKETAETYAKGWRVYRDNSIDYSNFPGLDRELDDFAGSLVPGCSVLDLGAGAGRDSRRLSMHGLRVIALDLVREFLVNCDFGAAYRCVRYARPFT